MNYINYLSQAGWKVYQAPNPSVDCPDSVFIEDVMVVFRGTCLITNPGNETRKKELEGIEEFVKLFGFNIVKVQDPGTLDGGDVLKVGN